MLTGPILALMSYRILNAYFMEQSHQSWHVNSQKLFNSILIGVDPLEYRPDLTEFFKVVMTVKFDIVKFNRTKIELIDYTSDKAIVSDEIMSQMFNYLAENLLNPRLVQENGEALITLCQNWSSFVIRNFDSFLERNNNLFFREYSKMSSEK